MDTTSTTARLKEFGTWTEQTSSSGKRYYYNSSTNISQWEKPTEWKHAEKLKATASLKNGNSNGGHNSAMQQMPKITKSAVENEKVSSSLPTIRMPQHQQPQPHKHSTQTGSSSTPTSTPPNFRPGTLSNLQQPFKAMTEKLNSQLATTMTSADKIPQNLCKVEATKTISSSSCFPASTSTTTLSARTIPTTSSSTLQTANATPSSSYQQVKRPPEKSPSSIHDSFCEEKYQKLWRPDLSGSRRALGVDSFAFDMRKSADRQTKQMAAIFALDKDIHSIRTLERTALLRTTLLKQRIVSVRQRTQELESKPQ